MSAALIAAIAGILGKLGTAVANAQLNAAPAPDGTAVHNHLLSIHLGPITLFADPADAPDDPNAIAETQTIQQQ